jgi:cellulose synthase (UDP-forming)
MHVATLKWGGPVTVLVLDDSARHDVELLALQYGFRYHSRPDRGRMKKAGNLLYGYQHSSGDLIAIFDADFCPRPDFLLELVPYFDDPHVGIVQSPQYFRTQGTMNWLQSAAGSVQEIFYRWVQPSRDAASGAICVGTCAIYRRGGLARSGGFAQIGHSEDVHTGVNLLKAGFSTRYVPVVVSAGLCPDNYAGFLSQQYRWCAGSMSLLRDTSFHAAPLTIAQRACFFTGFLYYLSTAITFFGGPLAAAVLIWALPQEVWPWIYLPLVAASWCVFAAWKSTLTARWNLSVLRVQMLYSAAHALAIWHTLRGRTASWVPTGSATEGISLSTKISRLALGWLVTVEVILVVGVARGVLAYGIERFWLSVLLTVFALTLVVPLLRPLHVEVRETPEIVPTSTARVWAWLSTALASVAVFAVTIAMY